MLMLTQNESAILVAHHAQLPKNPKLSSEPIMLMAQIMRGDGGQQNQSERPHGQSLAHC